MQRPLSPRALLALLAAAPLLAAGPEPSRAVVYGVEIPPFITAGPSGATGVVVDVVRLAFEELHEPVEVQIVPWARGFGLVKSKQATGIIPTIKTPERAQWMLFPEHPVFVFTMSFFQRKGARLDWNGRIDSVLPYRFVKLRGAAFAPEFDAAERDKRIRVEETNSFSSAIRMVGAGHADLAAVPLLAGQQLIAAEKLEGSVEAVEPAVFEQKMYLALANTPQNAALLARLEPQLAKLWQDGTIARLTEEYRVRRWLPKGAAPRTAEEKPDAGPAAPYKPR
jgi:polar amino acid transport system substrate-binding protein